MKLRPCTGCVHNPANRGSRALCAHPESHRDAFWTSPHNPDAAGYPWCYEGERETAKPSEQQRIEFGGAS